MLWAYELDLQSTDLYLTQTITVLMDYVRGRISTATRRSWRSRWCRSITTGWTRRRWRATTTGRSPAATSASPCCRPCRTGETRMHAVVSGAELIVGVGTGSGSVETYRSACSRLAALQQQDRVATQHGMPST